MRCVLLLLLTSCGVTPGQKDGPNDANGPEMRPGENCNSCHHFSAAGTVFSAVDADSSEGASGASITLRDAGGKTVAYSSNGAGNFYSEKSLTFPLTASITLNGVTKSMTQPITDGACSSCHAATGKNGAPGRLNASP